MGGSGDGEWTCDCGGFGDVMGGVGGWEEELFWIGDWSIGLVGVGRGF